MQLGDYITVLRRRWWVILLVGAVAAVAAYAFSKLQEPVFRAEAVYEVRPSRPDAALTAFMQTSMNNIRDSALARPQLERVSQQLQLDRSADWLLADVVSMQALPAEWKMIVRVDYPNQPDVAQRLADAVGENMVGIQITKNAQSQSSDRVFVNALEPARYVGLVSPNTRINVAAGLLLGLVAGLLLAFVLEALDNTLKTAQDVERFLGLTTVGAIPLVGADKPGTLRRAA
ncbi:MAG: lipopolysaccharide biosynthesis protein, partial [Roseiflexaceae bacterium]|nr:lipopolysaccharide biosynthesis protein [Roseiflexaceae bacterium]